MQRVLIDTSAWIEFFRGRKFTICDQVFTLILEDRVVNCGLVEYELLLGARKEEIQGLESQLNKLEYLEMEKKDYKNAADLSKVLKARGKNLKFIDLAIASFCIERNLLLLSLDSDFEGIPGLKRLIPNLI
jgi:predicted nucleic acid-binding protein